MRESAHPGASVWDVSTSNQNQHFIVGSTLRLLGVLRYVQHQNGTFDNVSLQNGNLLEIVSDFKNES